MMVKTYSYSAKEITKEYWRSGTGVTLSVLPLLLFRPSSVIVYILGSFLCLFAFYGVRAYGRKRMSIILGDRAIQVTGLREKLIQWEELEELKLAYFSTRRDGEMGWMQLRLKSRGDRLRVESTISDFWELVSICAEKAREKGLALDPATVRNMQALGLDTTFNDHTDANNSEKSN
ncbi:hypothetical protein A9Q83_15560 [Alphaproteobacteria bacterium 46_93_T64]|nr:hypothetical protein A9Q83_15560 [Alphaproteobacteria bacterium 46_93_T64]